MYYVSLQSGHKWGNCTNFEKKGNVSNNPPKTSAIQFEFYISDHGLFYE